MQIKKILKKIIKNQFFGAKKIGKNCKISSKAQLKIIGSGSITIGNNCSIHPYALIYTYGGNINIGDFCSINPFCILYGHGGLNIGNGVRIAASTIIIPSNHNFGALDRPIYMQGNTSKGISIADDVWIGAGVQILDDVKIGRGSIIGAGAVVTKSVPEYSIMAGNPAKNIGFRK